MKKIFNRVLIVMLMLTFTMTSCSDDDELIQAQESQRLYGKMKMKPL